MVLTLVSLALITVDARTGADGPLVRLREGVDLVVGTAQRGVARVITPVGDAISAATGFVDLQRDNARLRGEVAELRRGRRVLSDLARENDELRALLAFRDDLAEEDGELETLGARVVALAPSNFEWTVTVDVGSDDGVAEQMPVLTDAGLAGRVVRTSRDASRVLLAVDRSFGAAVRLTRSGEQGYIEGGGTEPLRLRLFDPAADVRPGDEVVTSTYRNGLFPEGLPVGRLAGFTEGSGGLDRDLPVQPFVDFTALDHVLVVLRTPPDAPFGDDGAADPSDPVGEVAPDVDAVDPR